MHPQLLAAALLTACATSGSKDADDLVFSSGSWSVDVDDDGGLNVEMDDGLWTGVRFAHATPAVPEIEARLGAFAFGDSAPVWHEQVEAVVVDGSTELRFEDGSSAQLTVAPTANGLRLHLTPTCASEDCGEGGWWWRWSADCDADEHFLGLGSHAHDVDHVGEAFPLWVSEPGVGKSDSDTLPEDWFITGTRHASSFPMPWLLRPQQRSGVLFETLARTEVDLCKTDSGRWSVSTWGPSDVVILRGERPADVVRALTAHVRRSTTPPRWAFGAWADAIRGSDRVREVAEELRAADASVSVIWSEDWKGAVDGPTGYRLSESWELDQDLYAGATGVDEDLEAAGFKWFAYFAPFVGMEEASGAQSSAYGALILDQGGAPYSFTGVTFKPTGHVDAYGPGVEWASTKMRAALSWGFDGWMADYGEWVPTDGVMGAGGALAGLDVHNGFPAAWQQLNLNGQLRADATFFCRSGWYDSLNLCPITWVGDQRTSFDADDGLPTVVPLVLGLSWSGVGISTHDVAGYQSLGNGPSDRELWMRWAALGAFSPIFRTHHGNLDTANWQFDEDEETLATFAALTREHAALLPYRLGLAAEAARDGTPMVRPTAWEFDGEPWDRVDAWMLGASLLVAPVLEAGAETLDVDLPEGAWFDWWTGAPAASGVRAAPLQQAPVFARAGTVVPVMDVVPDTAGEPSDPGLVGYLEADRSRELRVFGGGGAFVEADGTRYEAVGVATEGGTATETLSAGTITVGGVAVTISGPVERSYTVRVYTP